MSKTPVILIAAMNSMSYIGKDGDLIVKCARDLQRFKELSKNGVVIMGRKTYESLPQFLPNRTILVISKTSTDRIKHPKGFDEKNFLIVANIERAMEAAERLVGLCNRDRIVIAGGQDVYEQLLIEADEIYLTTFEEETLGDARFPSAVLDELVARGRFIQGEGGQQFYDGDMKVTFSHYLSAPVVELVQGDWVSLRTGQRFRLSHLSGYIMEKDQVALIVGSMAFTIMDTEANLLDLMEELDQLVEQQTFDADVRRLETSTRRLQTMQLVNSK